MTNSTEEYYIDSIIKTSEDLTFVLNSNFPPYDDKEALYNPIITITIKEPDTDDDIETLKKRIDLHQDGISFIISDTDAAASFITEDWRGRRVTIRGKEIIHNKTVDTDKQYLTAIHYFKKALDESRQENQKLVQKIESLKNKADRELSSSVKVLTTLSGENAIRNVKWKTKYEIWRTVQKMIQK